MCWRTHRGNRALFFFGSFLQVHSCLWPFSCHERIPAVQCWTVLRAPSVPPHTKEPQFKVALLWGISSKQVQMQSGLPWEKTQGSVNVSLARHTEWLCFISLSSLGKKVPAVQMVLVLCVCLYLSYLFTGTPRSTHMTGWFMIPGEGEGMCGLK